MKKSIFIFTFFSFVCLTKAQDSNDYIEFNDRKNVVHGVYMGISGYYGQIKNVDTYTAHFKVAYVANKQMEVGLVGAALYSEQNDTNKAFAEGDLVGFYGGIHFEPILFGQSKVNVSFPVIIGSGVLSYLDEDLDEHYDTNYSDWNSIFILEPGINLLYNTSRYLQLEAGIKYKLSSKANFKTHDLSRINGISVGLGVKIGVFNMGRNRYKTK